MASKINYRCYYDLEAYLFRNVSSRFQSQGFLDAFDFFSIIIWKANRAKSKTATRLMACAEPDESLDEVCRRLTASVHEASSDQGRFLILTKSPWGFALPMASAILTVLYPDVFTVYDYRVCDELRDFHRIKNRSDKVKMWAGYVRFREAVERSSSGRSLRNKDRRLIGRSLATQLKRDIEIWSGRTTRMTIKGSRR